MPRIRGAADKYPPEDTENQSKHKRRSRVALIHLISTLSKHFRSLFDDDILREMQWIRRNGIPVIEGYFPGNTATRPSEFNWAWYPPKGRFVSTDVLEKAYPYTWDVELMDMIDYHLQIQPPIQPMLPQRALPIDITSYMSEWPDNQWPYYGQITNGHISPQQVELKIRWPRFDRDAYQKLVLFLDQAMPTSSIGWDFEWNDDTLMIRMVGQIRAKLQRPMPYVKRLISR